MRVVIVTVDVTAVAYLAFQPVHCQVEAAQSASFIGFFDAADGEFCGGVFLMFGHKARRLYEHTARPAGGVKNTAVKGFNHFGEQAHDAARGIELATALALAHGESTEEVFVNAAKGVVVEGGRYLGDLLQQLLEQGAGEQVIGLGQHASELGIMLLDLTHSGVDSTADVRCLWQCKQLIKARFLA
ncbi:hypothetical protein D3C85_1171300 [compost metagenome]